MGLLVAVFNEKSDWPGKTVTYEDARHQFLVEGRGPVDAGALLGYDAQGQLDWAEKSLREWTHRAARTPAAPQRPSPSAEATAAPETTAAPGSTSAAPGDEAAQASAAHGAPPSAEALTPRLDVPSPSPPEPPVGARPRQKTDLTLVGATKPASAGPNPLPAPDEAVEPAKPGRASPSHPALAEAGFVCALFGFGVPFLGVLGLVLSIAARRQAQRLGLAKGLATAGIALGAISSVVGLLLVLMVLVG